MQDGRPTEQVLREGPGARIVALVEGSGGCRVAEFLEELAQRRPKAFDKIQALLWKVAEIGPQNVRNEEKVKALGGGLYEMKAGQVRIFWTYGDSHGPQRRVVLLLGTIKKRDRHISRDMKRARELKQEYKRGTAR